jgi:N-acetylglucosaminyl-diphospho-decaprenol L-rhamnosyltransferase
LSETHTANPVADAAPSRRDDSTPAADVSILIVSWNVKDLLRDCLASLRACAGHVRYETIVVDNQSSDGSPEMIRSEFPWVKLVEPKVNLGFGRGNNLAFRHADPRSRWVLLLNPDTVVLERAIERLVKFGDEQRDAGAVGGRTLKADMTLERSCVWGSPGLWPMICKSVGLQLLFKNSRLFNPEAMDWWARDTVREVGVITGCFLMIRREIYEKTGGFDPRFFMYAEEVDLCWRIKKLGRKLMFTPDAQIIHLVGASAAKAKPNRLYHLHLALLKLYRKHYGETYMKVANFLMWMFCATRVPLMYAGMDLGILNGDTTAKADTYYQTMQKHVKLYRRQFQNDFDWA